MSVSEIISMSQNDIERLSKELELTEINSEYYFDIISEILEIQEFQTELILGIWSL